MNFIKKLAYYYYRNRLKKEVLRNKIPGHIGIILDGNRRYAKKCGFEDASKGHKKGADKLYKVLSWCIELNIKVVTVWAFSTDNFKRNESEVNGLFEIIKSQFEFYINSKFINENKIRVQVIGKRELLSDDLINVIEKLEDKTKDYSNLRLYIALGYGGRQEICDAIINFISDNIYIKTKLNPAYEGVNSYGGESASSVLSSPENHRHNCPSSFTDDYDYLSNIITVENISKYLYAKGSPDPDLIIRTSGEIRLSGFLLWQSAYSEFYFCDAYWPEFREIDFLRAIRSYQSRRIRAGK
ncbi:MAG: polyprenyl diphosphate synthase [Deltaproteobacteria bacterium]|nr:polyprenyl diphosphate synthase [Deltaproteobacteria bacterium]